MGQGQRAELPMEEVAKRYRNGETTEDLGPVYGVNRATIWRRLVAVGVKMRRRGGSRGGPLHMSSHGYLTTYGRDVKQCRIHRACWEAYHGPIPSGYIVHHINGDRFNNVIENLACMSQSEHTRLHALRRRTVQTGTALAG